MHECDGAHYARSYCAKHYARVRNHGDPNIVLRRGSRGNEDSTNRKLSLFLAQKIYDLYMTGTHTQRDIARTFRVSHATVSHIVHGKTWSEVRRGTP